jgi:hypothetical protein
MHLAGRGVPEIVETYSFDTGSTGIALPGMRRPGQVPVREPAVVGEHEGRRPQRRPDGKCPLDRQVAVVCQH